MWSETVLRMVGVGILETFYMTFVSSFIAYVIGLPLGVILVVTDKNGIAPKPLVNKIIGSIVNLMRSIPFIILLVLVMPLTRFIVGTVVGSSAVLVPLIMASAPYIARLVESSLKEVDNGVIEAAQSMGANTFQIIGKVLLPEAMPSLIIGSAIATTTILGYTAMAGFVGGGGLGDIAIRYGYYRKESDLALVTVILMVLIVQGIQEIGARWMKHSDKRLQ